MQFVTGLLSIDKSLQVPVYLQIANGIIGHIRQGTLKPTSALPSSRALALGLKVHRNTVVAAYDELYAQSWVDVYPQKGIFIASNLPEVSPRPIADNAPQLLSYPEKTHFDVCENTLSHINLFKPASSLSIAFNEGFPDTRLAPVDLMLREYRRFAGYHFTSKYLLYGPEQGSENLRTELARFLGETRGLHVNPEHVLITKGAQMAIYLAAQLLLGKGDTVIAADPGYCGANEVFVQTGANLELVPVDECGIDLDAVEEICKKKKVKALYVIPHHHQPTTVTLSSERRMRLLELAMRYSFAILEDDYDYDFHYASSPILPLASADYYGSVIYIGSFCKTIAPGIRIGFMVAPPNLISQATKLRRIIDRQGEQLLEEAMANLLKNGDITRHLKKANKLYHERRNVFCDLLNQQLGEHVSFKIPDGGFAIWMKYLNGIKPKAVAEKAAVMGLAVSAGRDYYFDPSRESEHIRIGFASMNFKEMEQATDLLAKAVKKLV
ncbi:MULTISPECIES: PLP-dependent aminotransferase family protein [unclassified Mucilaginibacter]|uniref:MocR-like pyridoxine biosynthesis transcription factor PdxR n=1 Tax=unclassified Mucilaginibacter TaxID=2617802 RepID=UPI002AC93292|nr:MULTISPECIES: PLP-dependent aminotransferase family protein [unclassified Mucilaginibacter]MEB0263827.1 PLP-dependent aminotransferase family protein [Mucilaginibacter sp. 10I4]MEB0279765.1 PLP-dependent aminotransferase family protein [Mucilaginibacter sp. 10B2]MEB0301612.1 PLP-dependent aminotransferase family protein [Mucilaginibacter sp. 5C4]WPX23677.1 PLP-dependent aminotransferase family protein [Mucilaginibacter sp. 5C4]